MLGSTSPFPRSFASFVRGIGNRKCGHDAPYPREVAIAQRGVGDSGLGYRVPYPLIRPNGEVMEDEYSVIPSIIENVPGSLLAIRMYHGTCGQFISAWGNTYPNMHQLNNAMEIHGEDCE